MNRVHKSSMQIDYFDLIDIKPDLFDNTDASFKIILDKQQIQTWQEKARSSLTALGNPITWADIGIVLNDKYILVLRDLVEFPNGSLGGYIRIISHAYLTGGNGVVILPILGDKVILLHQYRHATRSWHLELPRGFGEPNMPAIENARKEIQEEINGVVSEIVSLGYVHNNTGLEGQKVEIFFGKLHSIGVPNALEGISEIRLVGLTDFERMIADSIITDAFTIVAYTRARLAGFI